MIHYDTTEIERLIDEYLNREISAADFEVLQCMLEKNATARAIYLDRIELDTLLFDHFSTPSSPPVVFDRSALNPPSFSADNV